MTKKITKLMHNGEEYLIREYKSGWQPGANTIAYYQFENNLDDSSGNGNDLSLYQGTAPSYGEISGTGKKYAIVSSGLPSAVFDLTINTWTVSQWIYETTTELVVCWFYGGLETSVDSGKGCGMIIDGNAHLVLFPYGGDIDTGVTITRNAWHNIIYTQGNGTTKVYVDGEYKTSVSKSYDKQGNYFRLFSNPYGYFASVFNGYYADIIIEDKTRTDQEISDYFNQTKSLYGIS